MGCIDSLCSSIDVATTRRMLACTQLARIVSSRNACTGGGKTHVCGALEQVGVALTVWGAVNLKRHKRSGQAAGHEPLNARSAPRKLETSGQQELSQDVARLVAQPAVLILVEDERELLQSAATTPAGFSPNMQRQTRQRPGLINPAKIRRRVESRTCALSLSSRYRTTSIR